MTEIRERWNAFGTAAALTPFLVLVAGLVLMPVFGLLIDGILLPHIAGLLFFGVIGLPVSVFLGLPVYALSLPVAWRLARVTRVRRAVPTFAGFGLTAAAVALPVWFAIALLFAEDNVAAAFQAATVLTLLGCLYAPIHGAVFGRVFAASLGAARRRRSLMTSKGDPS